MYHIITSAERNRFVRYQLSRSHVSQVFPAISVLLVMRFQFPATLMFRTSGPSSRLSSLASFGFYEPSILLVDNQLWSPIIHLVYLLCRNLAENFNISTLLIMSLISASVNLLNGYTSSNPALLVPRLLELYLTRLC